jgi:enterochelin esterase-like enzyme
MKFKLSIFALLILSSAIQAQSWSDFIDYAYTIPDPADRQEAVDSFVNLIAPQGIPWAEEDDLVHFLYQGTASTVTVAGDFNSWNPNVDFMESITGTDWWYRSSNFESNARLDYKFIVGGNSWILDPLNPNTVWGGFGPNSELAMPDYVQPWEIEDTGVMPQGTIQSGTVYSTNTEDTYAYKVYLPGEYADHPGRYYPTVYFHDGFEYLDLADAKNVLDNLIGNDLISPMIAVFIQPNDRGEEYAGNLRTAYRLFVVEEMVDHIQGQFRSWALPEHRATIGTSFGGNISGLISYHHPDVFGKAGLHSAAFWPNDYETYHLLNDNPAQDVKYAFVWGTYEGSLNTNLATLMPAMVDKGYELYENTYPEGHSWGLWRATLDELLIYLFPPGEFTGLATIPQPEWSVSPNPFVDELQLQLPESISEVDIRLFDVSGKLIWEQRSVAEGTKLTVPAHLGPGLYLLELRQGRQSLGVQKLIRQ